MKLIVSDLDGTLLNSKQQISPENIAALQAAQKQGIEIAFATGRTYANALALAKKAGLRPHIISNHGAFAYTKEGERLRTVAIETQHVEHAVKWLTDRAYVYHVCTENHTFVPPDIDKELQRDYDQVKQPIPNLTSKRVQHVIQIIDSIDGVKVIDDLEELFKQNHVFGSIVAMTFDREKLQTGRDYFKNYEGLTMTVAGHDIFEMIHTSASKGSALEDLAAHMKISLKDVLAVGDNFNDISMLKRAGISVAIGNAEEEVKKICKYQTLTNDQHGVAHIIQKVLGASFDTASGLSLCDC